MNATPKLQYPVMLSIAGSDSSAGAGIQADLKAALACGTYALTAITCVVSETSLQVNEILEVPINLVINQVKLLLETYPVAAIKTGMLYSPELILALASILNEYHNIPLVVDPVMIASTGDSLMKNESVVAYEKTLLPRATLITPNLDEGTVLWGNPIPDVATMYIAGQQLAQKFKTNILLKGGHLSGAQDRLDLLCCPDGTTHQWISPYIADIFTHGTGCTYSAAIAANIAAGSPLIEAITQAHALLAHAIKNAYQWHTPRHTNALNLKAL